MIKNFFLSILLTLISITIYSQTAEPLTVHFDKDFYVSGEDSWYTVYFQKELAAIESKVVRVEWIAPDGTIVQQQKLKVIDNVAIGDLAIPYDWTEGVYLFRAYTLWSLNFGREAVFQKEIPIYNLEANVSALTMVEDTSATKDNSIIEENIEAPIRFQFDKEYYTKRDSVTLIIHLKNATQQANLSMSVLDNNYWKHQTVSPSIAGLPTTNSNQYAVEKGLSINSQIQEKSGKPLTTQFLSLYFPDRNEFEQASIKDGQLAFSLSDFTGTQRVQIFDLNPFHEALPIIDMKDYPSSFASYRATSLSRSKEIANYLFLLKKYRQFKEVFQIPSPKYAPPKSFERMELKAARSFDMKDYKALSDLASFIDEVILGVRVLEKENKKSVRLIYQDKNSLNRRSPWYMVNDYVTNQENLVLSMSLRDIATMDLFDNRASVLTQLDPAMVSTGLVAITTKKETPKTIINQSTNIEVSGYYPLRRFPSFTGDTSLPDFRPIVYWQPIVKTDANGKAVIKFAASDAIGTFEVRVKGVNEKGEILEATASYKTINNLENK